MPCKQLTGPTDFGDICITAVGAGSTVLTDRVEDTSLTFRLGPGKPAMAAVWPLLAKTRFRAEWIESSNKHDVRMASVPFDISPDFLPDSVRRPDEELERLSVGLSPRVPDFAQRTVLRQPSGAGIPSYQTFTSWRERYGVRT